MENYPPINWRYQQKITKVLIYWRNLAANNYHRPKVISAIQMILIIHSNEFKYKEFWRLNSTNKCTFNGD